MVVTGPRESDAGFDACLNKEFGLSTIKAVIICLSSLALVACSMLQHSLQGYVEPTTGPIARVRFIGNDAVVYSADCANFAAKPAGHLNEWGQGKHSIGIPGASPDDDDAVEARVPAGRPITVEFMTQQPVAPPGYYYRYEPPPYCPGSTRRRTFVPEPNHDYEARMLHFSGCSNLQISEIVVRGGAVRSKRIQAMPAGVCEAPVDSDEKGGKD